MNTFRDRFLTPTEVTATVEIPEAPTVAQEYELVSVEAIQPHPDNARRGDIKTIRESIRNNGFVGACVVHFIKITYFGVFGPGESSSPKTRF